MSWGEIYNTSWWGVALDTARTVKARPDFFGSQLNLLTSEQPNLVVNGDFSDGTTGWTTGNSGVLSIVDGSLVVTGDGGSFASAKQVITGVVGKTYKLTGKVAVVSGSYKVRVEANQPSWLNLFTTSSTDFVNFVAYFVCVNTNIDLRFTIFNATTTSSDKISIDNVSVQLVRADLDQIEAKKCLADWIHTTALKDLNN
jgi:hypothetical protein